MSEQLSIEFVLFIIGIILGFIISEVLLYIIEEK